MSFRFLPIQYNYVYKYEYEHCTVLLRPFLRWSVLNQAPRFSTPLSSKHFAGVHEFRFQIPFSSTSTVRVRALHCTPYILVDNQGHDWNYVHWWNCFLFHHQWKQFFYFIIIIETMVYTWVSGFLHHSVQHVWVVTCGEYLHSTIVPASTLYCTSGD
jgi:hypothetical protein